MLESEKEGGVQAESWCVHATCKLERRRAKPPQPHTHHIDELGHWTSTSRPPACNVCLQNFPETLKNCSSMADRPISA